MWIKEINADSKSIEINSRVEKVILSTGNNGSNYLILNLVDKTGRIEARLWNCSEKDLELIKEGEIIRVDGVVNVYRQQLQIKINSYHIIDPEEYLNYGINDDMFAITAPLNIDKGFEWLLKTIEEVKNEVYRKITLSIIDDYLDEYKTYPAATSIHHNVIGGLFWHSFSLLKAAKNLQEIYAYAQIDWDLVFCGAVLHDIGKVIEMKGKNASEYTDEGKLIGHISIGSMFVNAKSKEFNLSDEQHQDAVKLQHIILASHGKHEYGSPVEPSLIEAIIVSSLDALDARIYRVNEELLKTEKNGWTARIMTEDGRSFLKHFKKQ
ncbi:3'-5' exoribonuclease [Spiroplasma helicoides]|uniref:3'-5' exoribonuclease n=1 Tax=Spiroplasma helicoides TaxID=216938 RepID=A0A1B3SL82_9MOLU|nr:HD domain-containing protein [Spiroplasma helicoides]AOG60698.1 3'-5' exoribonuclease [Spiroplasma helicoides]